MEWQPIETAPRNGTHILAWDGKKQKVVRFEFSDWFDVCDCSYADDGWCKPTHWMPLPEPPAV